MRKWIAGAGLLMLAAVAGAQTFTGAAGQVPIPGPLRSNYVVAPGVGKMVTTDDFHGQFIKYVQTSGNQLIVTYQDSSNSERSLTFTGGDGVLSSLDLGVSGQTLTIGATRTVGGPLNASAVLPAPGLDQSAVDARVSAGVKDWAETGGGQVPNSEIPSSIARVSGLPPPDGVIASGQCSGNDLVVTRTVGATVTIQEACIGSGGGAGEVNVQADWDETDNTSDAFIRNKPTIRSYTDVELAELHQLPSLLDRNDDLRTLTEPGWTAGPNDPFSTTAARPSLAAAEGLSYGNLFSYTTNNLDSNDWVTFRFTTDEDVRDWRIVQRVTGEDPMYFSGANFLPLGTSGSFQYFTYQILPVANAQLTVQRRNSGSLGSTTHYRGQVEAEQVQGRIDQHQLSSSVSGTPRPAGDLPIATGAGTVEWGTRPEEIVSGAVVPDDFVGPLFYLTHDQEVGTRDDLVINVVRVGTGTQVRWSRNSQNPMDGTTDSGDPGPLSEISGSGDPSATFNIALVGSHAPQQLDEDVVDAILLNDNEFALTGAYNYSASSDQYQRFINILGLSNPIRVNFRRDDGTWWYADSTLAHRAGLYEWDPNAIGGGEYVHTGVGSAQHGDINLLSIYTNWADSTNQLQQALRTNGNIYRNGGRQMRILAASAPFFARQSGRDFDIRYFPLRRVTDTSYLTTGDGVQIATRTDAPINQQEFLQGRLDDPILVDPGEYFMVAVHYNGTSSTQLTSLYGDSGTNETNTPIQNFTYVGPARTNLNDLTFGGPHQVYPTSTLVTDNSIRMQIEFEVPSLPGFTDIDVNGQHLISVPSGIEFNGAPVTGTVSADGNDAILTFTHDGALSGATCFGDNLRISRTGPTPNTFDVVDACATGGEGNSEYYAIPRANVGGTGDAIELTTGHSLASLRHGAMFFFESIAANTGAVTVTIDGQSATRNVQRSNGAGASTNLTGGEITNGDPILLVYEARFGILHWIPGHHGLLSTLNQVGTEQITDGAVTDAKLDPALRSEIHGQTSAQATYQVQGTVTSVSDNSQTNWLGNIFVANVDMVVYGGRAYVNRPSGGGDANYQVHVFPINRNSDTDFRIGNVDDVFHTPPDMVRNETTGGDFDDQISVAAGSGFTTLQFHTGELSGLSVSEGDHFAVVVTSRSQGRSYVVSNLDATPAEEPHIGDGSFPVAGFRWAAPFRDSTSTIGAGNNYYSSGEPTRVARMQINYSVAGGATLVGYEEGSSVYTGAAEIDCVGNGITCSENSDNQFEINVPGVTGGGTDGVVDDVTTTYSAATGEITVTLSRTVGPDVSDNVELPRAGVTQAGIARFANADETAQATADDLAISPRRLAGYVAQQGPAGGYDLTYGINQTATDRDGQNAHLLGNIYRAETDATIYRYRMRSDVPAGTSRTYTARFFKLDQISANNYQRGASDVMTAQARAGSTGAYSDTVTVGALATVTDVEVFIPAGFEVSDGEYFILGFSHGAASDTFLVVERGADEDSHIGHQDFPHATFSYVAKGASTSHEEPLTDSNMYGDNQFAMRMQFDYEVPALMTAAEEGTVVFLGAANINCVGAGVTCSEDSAERLEINVPGGGTALDIDALQNLASNDIADTDQMVIYDGSASANRSITQGELAARLADGTTITSSGGTLTAVGGGGGGTITDAALDVDDPTTESTTAGASRQAIAESISANRVSLTDTTLNVNSPANESTTVAASRQAIAEAIRAAEDPEHLPLSYAIAQDATARNSADSARDLGNIYQANTPLTVHGATFRVNVPTAAGRYQAFIFRAVRQGTDQFRRTGDIIFATFPLNVPANTPTTIGFVFPGQGLSLEDGEYFGILVANLGGNLLAATLEEQGVVEETHIGLHTDIGDTISYQCKAFATAGSFGRDSITHDYCRNSDDSTWMHVSYSLGQAGLLTLDDEGTQAYLGTPRVNCVGAGITCSDESGRATITVPGSTGVDLGNVSESILPDSDNSHGVGSSARTFAFGHFNEVNVDSELNLGSQDMGDAYVGNSISGQTVTFTQADGTTETLALPAGGGGALDIGALTNLPSGDISDTDQLVVNDVSVPENKHITIGELAARLADGSTITSSGGTLTAVGGGGGGGGGGFSMTEIGSQNVNISATNSLQASGITVPADTYDWLLVNLGAFLATVGTRSGEWVWVRESDFSNLTASTTGGLTASTQVLELHDKTSSSNADIYIGRTATREVLVAASSAAADMFPLTILGVTEGGGGGGGGSTDLQNIAGDLLPDADNSRAVGTAARTWANGRFTALTVDDTLVAAGATFSGANVTVGNDLITQADVRIADNEQLIFGDDSDLTIDYDTSESDVEMRLGTDADRIVVYDGTGNDTRHSWERDGDATVGRNLTVGGTINVSGVTTLSGNVTVGGITVTGDLEAQNDIHLGDRDQIILGNDNDATFDYDDRSSEVEIRLNPSATAFVIYDGIDDRHTFHRNGNAEITGTLDVGDLEIGGEIFQEAVEDDIDGLLTAGTNITLDYDDAGNALTINSITAARDAEGGRFSAPSAACEFQLAYDKLTHNLEVCTNVPHVQGAAGTWIDDIRTDLSVEESRAFISSPTLNDYVFDAGAQHFYQWTVVFSSGTTRNAWVQVTAAAALAASAPGGNTIVFLGEQPSDDAATALIVTQEAAHSYFYVRGDVIRELTSFTAPTTTDHWEWKPVHQGLVVLKLTQTQYDGLTPKDPNVLYVIVP